MAKPDRPWWGKGHTIWGGETFHCNNNRINLGVKKGDVYRIEKSGNTLTLVPHPDNEGTWNESHSETSPIVLTEVDTANERAFSMMVKITKNSAAKELFFIERHNGSLAISEDPDDPGTNGGTAAVER